MAIEGKVISFKHEADHGFHTIELKMYLPKVIKGIASLKEVHEMIELAVDKRIRLEVIDDIDTTVQNV